MNKFIALFFVVVLFVASSMPKSNDNENDEAALSKEAILELMEVLDQRNITQPDKERANKDLQTLIQEVIKDLKNHLKENPESEDRELSEDTIRALEEEVLKVNEAEKSETTTNKSD